MLNRLSRFLPLLPEHDNNRPFIQRNDSSGVSLSTWLASRFTPSHAGSFEVLNENILRAPDGSGSMLFESYKAALEKRVVGIEHVLNRFVRDEPESERAGVMPEHDKIAALSRLYNARSKLKRGSIEDRPSRELALHAVSLGDVGLLNYAASNDFKDLPYEMKGDVRSALASAPEDYRAYGVGLLKSDFFQQKSLMDKADLIDVLATGDKAFVDYVRAYFDALPRARIWEMTNLAREGKAWGF